MTEKSPTTRQLVFDLTRAPCFDRDDFLVSTANEAAVAAVRRFPDWPGRTLLIVGPRGSGKSHLATIWAADVGATRVRTADQLSTLLQNGGSRCVLFEDCDRGQHAEAAFFHALNLAREKGSWLLMTARTIPNAWGLQVADLLSRLRSATLATISNADAALLKAVLVKLFADRQIVVDDDVIAYAAKHCEQSLDAANRFVAAVDEAALASNRRITRPLAAKTLALLGPRDFEVNS